LNLEYDDVTITRRLFRSGDSEYYINKSPCRLKDITEMFLDTGLGKDVYSVIGQGRVDEIINSRPEERREIFEEAAGILKYKIRKKEARRRLDETRDNLVRVQDLIYELETQVEPLQAQAEVTRRYRALQERVEEQEKGLLSYQLQQSHYQLEKVNRQLQNLNDALLKSAAQGGQHEKEIQDLKNRITDQQRNRKDLEYKLSEVSRSLEQKESESKVLFERENRFREQLEQNRQRVQHLELLMDEYAQQKEKAQRDLQVKNDELAELNKELEKLKEKLAEHKSTALAEEVEEKQEAIYKKGTSKEAASSTMEELKNRLERIKTQKQSLQNDQEILQEKINAVKERSSYLAQNVSDLQNQHKAAGSNAENKGEILKQSKGRLEQALNFEQKQKENLYDINSRLNLLKEQDNALSGYYRGVKEVMQARNNLSGIVGPVADLMSIDNQYVQAVESALGSSLQYLVAESERSVQNAIRYLKENNKGWATFLPLDILKAAADPLERFSGWRDLDGVIGKASELVTVDQSYRKAIDYLLSSVLVCKDLQTASNAARYIKHSCRVVTLEGEMINPGGIMRGGSLPKRNAGMPLGRRKEIEELQKQQKLLLAEVNKAENFVKREKESLKTAEENAKRADRDKNDLEKQLNEVQKDYDQVINERDNLQEKYQSLQKNYQDLDDEEQEIKQRLVTLGDDIKRYSETIEALEKELSGVKEEYKQFIEKKNSMEQEITAFMVKITSYAEQRDALSARMEEIDNNMKSPAAEKEEKNNEYQRHTRDLEDNQNKQAMIRAEIDRLTKEKADLIAEVEEKNKEVNQVEADLIDLEEQDKRRQTQLSRQEKRERQLSVEQSRLETEINYQEIRFKEQFKDLQLVTLEDGYDPEESRKLIDNLKEDLEELGEVNLGAIDELARLEERINFLKEQRDDLQKGEASLQKVLAEIDQRMEYYFDIAFKQISGNVKQTFEELFEGGKVLLRLTDPDNILESGIEIVAQPPGKKLQNITLLSAGEKVLTAIALVFAILRFKPAPFYLLDEVESTLDDANLSRFTRFLKRSVQQAQFILITHRKRTMEEAEVLYGVTMPEPGVSRLMSLKIEDNLISSKGS
ncbi:MAG: chromosome segregation protein SMC, partial [Bacillota bacterium]